MIQMNNCIQCSGLPCQDVQTGSNFIPNTPINPETIHSFMITEAPTEDLNEHLYASGNPFFLQTTLQAFADAGFKATSLQEIIDKGFYITTAIKCAKTGYDVTADTIKNCSKLLQQEMDRPVSQNSKSLFRRRCCNQNV